MRGAIAQLRGKPRLSGAVLTQLLKRMGSSPPALAAALQGSGEKALQALAPQAAALAGEGKDGKLAAFRELLDGPLAGEKVLVFAEARETIDYLKERLARPSGKRRGMEALAYVGDLQPAERDKLVARFRDPEGPRVLLCTELGGEGRNFQHCHVLFNYDLAWSPAAIEQRIGRIDRIGQSREVRILAFRPAGTLAAHVLDVLDEGVGVFSAPVGGLDHVLESVEAELTALGAGGRDDDAEWAKATRAIAAKVGAARAEVARAFDPLLDRRSCDAAAVRALAERAALRLGMRLPEEKAKGKAAGGLDALAAQLSSVAGALEQRLEQVTLQIALRVGLAADDEVDVLPGEVSFQVGPELKVDALAGFDLSQDRVVLGSFRREVAVAHEEHDSFATGHPLVEALFGWVRDGELGRATVARAKVRGGPGAALDGRWTIALPEAADLAQGARVPSRRAARLLEDGLVRVVVRLDGRGGAQADDALASALDAAALEPVPAPDGGPPAAFVAAVEGGRLAAQAEAERRLARFVAAARQRVEEDAERSFQRLVRFFSQSGATKAQRERALAAERRLHEETARALDGARLELDQLSLVQLL